MEKVINIIFYAGSIQGFFLAAVLFSIKSNRLSNRILAVLSTIWGILLLVYALQAYDFYIQFPHFLLVFDQLVLLIFPLFFLYAKYLLQQGDRYESRDLWHFLPFIASVLAGSGFFIQSAEEKLNLIRNLSDYLVVLKYLSNEIVSIQSILYPVLVFRLIRRYKSVIKSESADNILLKVNLLQLAALTILLFWSFSVTCLHLSYLGIAINFDYYAPSYISLIIIIYFISFISLRSTEVFKVDLAQSVLPNNIETAGEQSNSALSPEINQDRLIALNEKLLLAMQQEKYYLNQGLSLQDLADHFGASRNEVSIVINRFHQKNFFDFINEYRVEEAKKLLTSSDTQSLTMENVGYSAGFNSRASFYRIFKQVTNRSPMQFVKEEEKTI